MQLPRPFGPYTLLAPLGKGGMGAVYLAARSGLSDIQQVCVVKTLRSEHADDAEYVSRFEDEARVVVQLSHRNIARVFDVGIVDGTYYMAMELVRGVDLQRIFSHIPPGEGLGGPLSTYIVTEVLEALDYAHRFRHPLTGEPMHIVHRDVSPHNVMVSFEGEVRLIDFGLTASTLKRTRTNPNFVMGKLMYMSPEQARDNAVDGRADAFAAAIIYYELLTGSRFYDGLSHHEMWEWAGRGGYLPDGLHGLPAPIQDVLRRALAPRPSDRYETAGALRAELVQVGRELGWFAGAPELREKIERLCADDEESDRLRLQSAISSLSDKETPAAESTKVVTLASVLEPSSTGEGSVIEPLAPNEATEIGGFPVEEEALSETSSRPTYKPLSPDEPTEHAPASRPEALKEPTRTVIVHRGGPKPSPPASSRRRGGLIAAALVSVLTLGGVAVLIAPSRDAPDGPVAVEQPPPPAPPSEPPEAPPEEPPPAETAPSPDRDGAELPKAADEGREAAASEVEAPPSTSTKRRKARSARSKRRSRRARAAGRQHAPKAPLAPPPPEPAMRKNPRPPAKGASLADFLVYLRKRCEHSAPSCRGHVLKRGGSIPTLDARGLATLRSDAERCAYRCPH